MLLLLSSFLLGISNYILVSFLYVISILWKSFLIINLLLICPILIYFSIKSEFLGLPATSLSDPKDIEKLRSRLSKFWTFESKNCFTNKEKTISRTKTVLIGKFFDVCIERYKNTQGIRQKVFDTKLNL